MNNIQDLQTLAGGIQEKLKTIRGLMDQFNKAKGILEEEEKLRVEAGKFRADLEVQKTTLSDLQKQKNNAMIAAVAPMAAKMNEVLPSGKAVLKIEDDGSFMIGWLLDKNIVPYHGLSGGEKAAFDPALCRALGGTILVVEAAELDSVKLHDALKQYSKTEIQVIVSSCHNPGAAPLDWKEIQL
jgi:hypothetical protein